MHRKSRKRMTFKFCDAPLPPIKKLQSIKHVNVLVMGSSTEYPTTITNCLITFRMKNMPRANWSISMQPIAMHWLQMQCNQCNTATPIPSILLKKEKKPNR